MWEIGGVVLLFLTFVFGSGLVIVTGRISEEKKQEALAAARALENYKLEAGEKIAAAQAEAGHANEAAGNANEKAGKANERAGNANERSLALEVEALRLREQLATQGPRENLLRGENREKLVSALKPFAGQRVDFRHSASVIEVNGKVVMSTPIGDDTLGLAVALIGVAKDAGWESPSAPLLASVVSQGIEILVVRGASEKTMQAAIALGHSLRAVAFEKVHGPVFADNNRANRVGEDTTLPAFDKDTIVVEVLSHP